MYVYVRWFTLWGIFEGVRLRLRSEISIFAINVAKLEPLEKDDIAFSKI